MEYSTSDSPINTLDVDGVIIGVYEDLSTTFQHEDLDKILQIGNFAGKNKKSRLLFSVNGINAPIVALVGLGKKEEVTGEDIRFGVAGAARLLRSNGAKSIGVSAYGDARASAEGVSLGLYRLDELKSKPMEDGIEKVIFTGTDTDDWTTGLTIADAQNKARRLGNYQQT